MKATGENPRKVPVELYCGFRKRSSFTLYEPFLNGQLNKGNLAALDLVLSREAEKEYVSHRLLRDSDAVLQYLKEGGIIMLCGSISMQNDVMKVLEDICTGTDMVNLPHLIEQGQVLTDCY